MPTPTPSVASASPSVTFAVVPSRAPSLISGGQPLFFNGERILIIRSNYSEGLVCVNKTTCHVDSAADGRYVVGCATQSGNCDVMLLRKPSNSSKCLIAEGSTLIESDCPSGTRSLRFKRDVGHSANALDADVGHLPVYLSKRAVTQLPYWSAFTIGNASRLINANLDETNGCLILTPPPSNVYVGACNESGAQQWSVGLAAETSTGSTTPLGAIIGGVVGGVAALAAIAAAAVVYKRKKNAQAKEEEIVDAYPVDSKPKDATESAKTMVAPPANFVDPPKPPKSPDRDSHPSSGDGTFTAGTPSLQFSGQSVSVDSVTSRESSVGVFPGPEIVADRASSEGYSGDGMPMLSRRASSRRRPGTIIPESEAEMQTAGSTLHRVFALYNKDGANATVTVEMEARCMVKYERTDPSEISMEVGDRVFIETAFSDGWGLGTNLVNGMHGYFPADFLDLGISDEPVLQDDITSNDSEFSRPTLPMESLPPGAAGHLMVPGAAFSRASLRVPQRTTSQAAVFTSAADEGRTTEATPFPRMIKQGPSKLLIKESDVEIDREKKLGEGGFGVVYVGTLRGKLKVAVKTLKGGLDGRTMNAFVKEVANWEGLVQRNVLPLMHFCVSPPMMVCSHFIPFNARLSQVSDVLLPQVMDLIKEGNLRQYLSRHNWNQKRGRELLLDVATGMTYLHSLDILHGDLKSLNVLVDGSRAVITDFGLSKVLKEVTKSVHAQGGLGGTPGFVSPELLTGKTLEPPADVYAFAMVCYEVVSRGKYPFYALPNAAAIVFQVAIERKRPTRPDGTPDAIWELMERCWAHEPEARPGFATVKDDLEAML